MKVGKVQLESLMMLTGDRGKFQLLIHLLLSYTYITILFNHVIMAFLGMPIEHTCMPNVSDIDSYKDDTFIGNGSVMASNHSSYNTHQHVLLSSSQCSAVVHVDNEENKTLFCGSGQWKYSPPKEERNIISEFDLVCSEKHLGSLATTIYFAGVMLGGLVFGDLADRFGRLPILFTCIYCSSAVGVATAFSVNYTMFVILRFINGILIQGLQTSGYTLIMELYRAKYRPFGGAVAEVFFGCGTMILSGLAYFIPYWRHLQIAISCFGVLSFFYIFVVPESLRWLIINGKMEKADALVKRICRTNKISQPDDILIALRQDKNETESTVSQQQAYNITYLFRTPKLRIRTLILSFLWLVTATCFYGVTYKMTRFKVNRYLLFFIGGAAETFIYALSCPIMNFFGRKKPLLCGFIVGGIMCVTSGFINDYTEGLEELTAGLALVGRCAIALVFAIIFVYTSELYPTVVRNIGVGFACFWARVGGVLAPQINQWGREAFGFDAIILFGALSLIAGFILLLLNETHNVKMADSIQEVENEVAQKEDVALMSVDREMRT